MMKKLLADIVMRVMVIKGEQSLKRLEKSEKTPMKTNAKLLKKIVHDNRNTVYGKLHDFKGIRTIEDFRRNVPISEYEDFAPFIERTKAGEDNVLTASKILGYSRTSGSSGVPKYIPATKHSVTAYVRYTWTRALALGVRARRAQGEKFKPGRGVFLSPATNECLPTGVLCSNIAEICARRYGAVYPFIMALPERRLFDVHDGDYIYNIYRFALADPDVSLIFSVFYSINVSQLAYLQENWRVIVDDIERGTISDSIDMKPELRARLLKKIRPMPERAAYLRKQFEQGFDETIFKRIWPNLCVISSIGNASFKPASDYVRSFSAGIPLDYSIYGASEALIAACCELESTDMQLLTDSCFYEFISIDDDNRLLTLDQLEQGKKYEILITTQAGLYRYHLKDVIEVKGFRGKCPIISFVFRKGQMFNIAGEKFSEEDARNSIEMLADAHNTHIDHWLFYHDESVVPNRYVLAVEPGADIDWESAVDELEGYIGQCNKRYTTQREKAFIGRLLIRMQEPGTHDEWSKRLIEQGASMAQVKPVHSLDNETKREYFLSRMK